MSKTPRKAHAAAKTPPWKKKRPRVGARVRLSAEEKEAARARAKRAGRRYPNLIDDMWAAKRRKARG